MVYEQTVVDASSKPNTLFMLSQLESTLEDLLIQIEKMPIDYVIKAEKEKEKRRRERKREEQQALQERLQEERNKRAIERYDIIWIIKKTTLNPTLLYAYIFKHTYIYI
jgi:hypothetical protein